jgi:hypothetical protein
MKIIVALALWISTTSIALSQVAEHAIASAFYTPVAPTATADHASQAMGFLDQLGDGSFIAQILAMLFAILMILRGLAEGLTKLSELTDNKWDNKLAGWFSSAAWILGSVLGKFGYGTPSLVLAETAKEAISGAAAKDTKAP